MREDLIHQIHKDAGQLHPSSRAAALRSKPPADFPKTAAMSISYSSPLAGSMDSNLPKAPQACMSCRKQKRKCNKGLPACSLCERMGRLCDYSDASPAPTSDDFNALRQKLLELERRLNGSNGPNGIDNPTYLPTPSASTVSGTADSVGATPGNIYLQQDPAYQNVQNRFPGIAFLDSEAFKYGQIVVPKPSVDIPVVSVLISLIWLEFLFLTFCPVLVIF